MKIKPIGPRVLIKPDEVEEKTSGGIYLPDSAKEKTNQGTVIEVSEVKDMPVSKGDRIMYESYAGTEVTIEKKRHMIISTKDIIAKVV